MAGFTDELFNDMLGVFVAQAVEMSLHTGDPGPSGALEVSGPGYAREPVTWDTPESGQTSASTAVEFGVPASTLVVYAGFWDGSADWLGSVPLSQPEPFTGPGTLELEPITIAVNN